jgi:OOP family OmpA-OmpF porin
MKPYAASVCAVVLVGLLAAQPVLAEKLGWYTGLGVGISSGKLDDDSIEDELADQIPGATVGSVSSDRSSWTGKILLGYSFTSFLAVEASAFWLGDFKFDASTTAGTFSGKTDVWGGAVDVLAFFPLTDRWRVFGRVGGVYAKTDTWMQGSAALSDQSGQNNDFGWKAGAGVAYEFDSGVAFRAEWEHYQVEDGLGETMDVDTFSGSVLYRFK